MDSMVVHLWMKVGPCLVNRTVDAWWPRWVQGGSVSGMVMVVAEVTRRSQVCIWTFQVSRIGV